MPVVFLVEQPLAVMGMSGELSAEQQKGIVDHPVVIDIAVQAGILVNCKANGSGSCISNTLVDSALEGDQSDLFAGNAGGCSHGNAHELLIQLDVQAGILSSHEGAGNQGQILGEIDPELTALNAAVHSVSAVEVDSEGDLITGESVGGLGLNGQREIGGGSNLALAAVADTIVVLIAVIKSLELDRNQIEGTIDQIVIRNSAVEQSLLVGCNTNGDIADRINSALEGDQSDLSISDGGLGNQSNAHHLLVDSNGHAGSDSLEGAGNYSQVLGDIQPELGTLDTAVQSIGAVEVDSESNLSADTGFGIIDLDTQVQCSAVAAIASAVLVLVDMAQSVNAALLLIAALAASGLQTSLGTGGLDSDGPVAVDMLGVLNLNIAVSNAVLVTVVCAAVPVADLVIEQLGGNLMDRESGVGVLGFELTIIQVQILAVLNTQIQTHILAKGERYSAGTQSRLGNANLEGNQSNALCLAGGRAGHGDTHGLLIDLDHQTGVAQSLEAALD